MVPTPLEESNLRTFQGISGHFQGPVSMKFKDLIQLPGFSKDQLPQNLSTFQGLFVTKTKEIVVF